MIFGYVTIAGGVGLVEINFFKGPSMQQSMLETIFSLSLSGPADFDLSAVSVGCIKVETMKVRFWDRAIYPWQMCTG